jgi:hypothetical protein
MAEVNKVNSWEDVISDNYNSEPIVEEQLEEAVVVEDVINDEVIVEDNNIVTDEAVIPQEQEQEQVIADTVVDTTEDVINAKEDINLLNSGMSEDEIFEYLSLKRTNYNEINDVDIVSGIISSENPNWDTDDIEFELEQKYGSALFEEKVNIEEIDKDIYPEEYKEALLWNKQIEKAHKLLKRDAIERRAELEEIKNNIQLPKSSEASFDNNKSSVDATEQQKGLSDEQVQYLQKQWLESVERDVPTISEFKFKLGDEEVSYKVTADEQKEMVQKMKEFNAEDYLVKRGWVKPDGTADVKKITEDVYILENSEKMFKSGWTQAKESAKMDIIGRDIKNINLSDNNRTFDAKGGNDPYGFGNYVLDL